MLALGACRGDKPEPTKVNPSEPIVKRPRRPDANPTSPFRHADKDPPTAREGEQLPEEELEEALKTSLADFADGRRSPAITGLRRCANKLPASARCDGELGLIFASIKQRRGEADYYLVQAADVDDPKADADLYGRVGDKLRQFGKLDEAASALEKALARDTTHERHAALSGVFQSVEGGLPRAADELGKAYELAPENTDYLFERATVLGQVQTAESAQLAADLFAEYLEKAVDADATHKDMAKLRISELKDAAKVYAKREKEGGEPAPKKKKKG
jgi:tetratricopeptide (TPR) repeat protein